MDGTVRRERSRPEPGLCGRCLHARAIRNRNGSVFLLCERSRTDDRFPRYPPLPVLSCAGFELDDPEPEEQVS